MLLADSRLNKIRNTKLTPILGSLGAPASLFILRTALVADESEHTHGPFFLGTVRPPTPSLTYSATMARGTGFVGSQTEEVFSAPLTLSPIRVPLAIGTVAAVSGGAIELRVKVALLGAAIAVTGYNQRYQGLPQCCFLLRGFGGQDLKEGGLVSSPNNRGSSGLGRLDTKTKNITPQILRRNPPASLSKKHVEVSWDTGMLQAMCLQHRHAEGHMSKLPPLVHMPSHNPP